MNLPFGFVDDVHFLSASERRVLEWAKDDGTWKSHVVFELKVDDE